MHRGGCQHAGERKKTDPRSPCRFQGFCCLFEGSPCREDVVDQEDRASLNAPRARHLKRPIEIESAGLPTEEALGKGRVPLREDAPTKLGAFVFSENFVDLFRKKA